MKKFLILFFILVSFFSISFANYTSKYEYVFNLPSFDKYKINLIQKVSPAVVSVIWFKPVYKYAYKYIDLGDWFTIRIPEKVIQDWYYPVSAGTAFFVSPRWLLVTNAHVVDDKSLKYKIITSDGKKYPVKILAISETKDLALLYVKGKNFPYLKLGNSNYLSLWQTVFAIWNALWQYTNSVSQWIVSWLGRTIYASRNDGYTEIIKNAIQTDAAINPWNSWWPLIDSLWNVVWINTAVDLKGQNIGFAIPINEFKKWVRNLIKK